MKFDDGESTRPVDHELRLSFQQLFATWFRIIVSTIASWFIAGLAMRYLLGGPFRRFDFLWIVIRTYGVFGATFAIAICSAIVALCFTTIVYLMSRGRVSFFWGFSVTRDTGAVFGAIVGGIAGVLTVLAGR